MCSEAAAARSRDLHWPLLIQARYAPSSRTNRHWSSSFPTASRCWRPLTRSTIRAVPRVQPRHGLSSSRPPASTHPPRLMEREMNPRPQELPTAQMVANRNRFLAHCLRPVTRYSPNIAALRATPARIVVGRGTSSAGQLAHRTATALASELGTSPVEFPGDHIGFASEPDRFVDVLRRAHELDNKAPRAPIVVPRAALTRQIDQLKAIGVFGGD